MMPMLDHRALATVVWALASLHRPAPAVFDAVAERAVCLLRTGEGPTTVSPQSISMMLWAFASSQHKAPRLFAEAEAYAALRLSEFEPRSAAMLLWGFASAHHPAHGVFSTALQLMPRIANRLSSPHVRTLLVQACVAPSMSPSQDPSASPSMDPSSAPSAAPSKAPSAGPTQAPTPRRPSSTPPRPMSEACCN